MNLKYKSILSASLFLLISTDLYADPARVTPRNIPILSVKLTPDTTTHITGTKKVMTYTVTNTGVNTATNVGPQVTMYRVNGKTSPFSVYNKKWMKLCNIPFLDAKQTKTCVVPMTVLPGNNGMYLRATGMYGTQTINSRQTSLWYTGTTLTNIPALHLEFKINGLDADTGTGKKVHVGDTLNYTLTVKNSGKTPLTRIVAGIGGVTTSATWTANKATSCNIGNLAINQTKSCTITTNKATLGQKALVGTAIGRFGTLVVYDSDPSHYLAVPKGQPIAPLVKPVAAINIETSTNGVDADTGTGPKVKVGSNLTWTYTVQNTGNVTLTNVAVSDNKAGHICTIGTLAVGLSKTCTKTGTATTGQYANIGKVTGVYGAQSVNATDVSHYKGKKKAATTYAIGDQVWKDNNNDALQNNGEAGFKNILLKLYKGNQVVKTTRTSLVGQYLFSNLTAGNYCVEVVKPNSYTLTTGGAKNCFTLNANKTNVDFGLMKKGTTPKPNPKPTAGKGSVGDLVWYDRNRNGIQDAGERGIKNKVVRLYKANGRRVATTRTDANGKYLFSNIPNGQYFIKFTIPKKYSTSPQNQGTNTAQDSDGAANGKTALFTVASNANTSIDMGLTKGGTAPKPNPGKPTPVKPAAGTGNVGDLVWFDRNKNGIQDAGEKGIKNKVVKLYKSNGRRYATRRTDVNGKYLFKNVPNGQYYIRFTIPKKYTTSPQNQGANTAKDSDGAANGKTALFTVASNSNLSIDMGLTKGGVAPKPNPGKPTPVKPAAGTGNVGDLVWFDRNKNGIQDAGEKGIKNKVVKLYKSNGRRFKTTRTNINGKYLFKNVPNGQYYIRFTIPKKYTTSPQNQGANTAKDSDGAANGKTALFTVASNSNLSIDMGLTKGGKVTPATGKGNIGDLVWYDKDHDGIQDAGETGVQNIKVAIYDVNDKALKITKTDANGNYSFKNMPAGKYIVKFTLPACTQASPMDEGTNDAKDSDGDYAGVTDYFNYNGKSTKLNIDMGLSFMGCSTAQKKKLNVTK